MLNMIKRVITKTSMAANTLTSTSQPTLTRKEDTKSLPIIVLIIHQTPKINSRISTNKRNQSLKNHLKPTLTLIPTRKIRTPQMITFLMGIMKMRIDKKARCITMDIVITKITDISIENFG